jgi:RNA polymerase sigma factor (sigma-70 family)
MPLPSTHEGKVVLYQALLRKEKLILLKIPQIREAAAAIIGEMQSGGNNRRISAMDMGKAVGRLKYGKEKPEDLLEVNAVKLFQIDKWNRLREAASVLSGGSVGAWKRATAECASVRADLILDLLPVVKSRVLRRFQKNSFDFDHMVNEGVMGVIAAMEKYDHTRGTKFKDYAKNWIDMRLLDIYKKASTVTMTGAGNELKSKVKKARERLESERGRAVTQTEVAEAVGISEDDIDTVMVYVASISEPVGDEDESTLADIIPGELELPELAIDRQIIAERIERIIQALSQTEREVSIFRIPPGGYEIEHPTPVSPREARMWIREWVAGQIVGQIEKEQAA